MSAHQHQAPAQVGFDTNESTLPWQDLTASVFRRRRILLTAFGLGVLLSTLWAWTLPPTYKATALLMVRDNRTRLAVSPDEGTGSLMDRGGAEEINSLVALFTSPVLVQEILAKDEAAKAVSNATEAVPQAGLFTWLINLPSDLYRHLHNVPEPSALEVKARAIAEAIVVSQVQKSNVLELAYYSGSPKFSAYFANRVVDEGIAKYTRLYDTSRAQEFYRDQRDLLAAGVDRAQVELNAFRERVGPELLTLNRDQLRVRIAEFEQAGAATRTEIAELKARRDAPAESVWQDATSADPSTGIVVNPAVHAIKARLVELEIKRSELISRYAPKSAMISDMNRQIAEARRLLEQEQARTIEIHRKDTVARIEAAQARLDALAIQLTEYRDNLTKLETLAPEWERLENEIATRRQAYQTYLRKEEEARFTNALDESRILNVTVAEPARAPNAPEGSPMFKLIFAGTALSLVVGVALALVRDWMDPSVKTTTQAERLTGIPVLGEIPL